MYTCFGEYLMRLSPPDSLRFAQMTSLDVRFGGAEANVAAALTGFGLTAAFVTRLPDHAIGDAALCALRSTGVDCTFVSRGGERIGTYFLEKGSGVRPSKVIYDRKGSAIAEAAPDAFDWHRILSCSDGFFFTGITAALSSDMPAILREALAVCREKNIPTACDLNYRATLWPADKAGATMRKLVHGLDLLIANEEHAALLLDVRADDHAPDDDARLRSIAYGLSKRYDIATVVLTLRRSISADDNVVSAVLYDRATDAFVRANEYPVHILDRVGGGDALTSGVLYARRMGWSAQKTVEFGTAANAFKHSIEGDTLIASVQEIEAAIQAKSGDGTVRMVR